MDHSNDDRYLHLQAVHEVQVVRSHTPYWVNANRVYTFRTQTRDGTARTCLFNIVAAAESVEADRHEVIVDDAAVQREKAHHHQQVTMRNQHVDDLVLYMRSQKH